MSKNITYPKITKIGPCAFELCPFESTPGHPSLDSDLLGHNHVENTVLRCDGYPNTYIQL